MIFTEEQERELQMWLVGHLQSGEIEVRYPNMGADRTKPSFFWTSTWLPVTKCEWLEVCRRIVAVVPFTQGVVFRHRLAGLSIGPKARYRSVEEAMCQATWQERAFELRKVLGGS